jgi:hypothetical protein
MQSANNKIGLYGGGVLIEIGEKDEILKFFRLIHPFLNKEEVSLMRILYLKYVDENTLTAIQGIFEKLKLHLVEDKLFIKIYNAFMFCAETAKLNMSAFGDMPNYKFESIRFLKVDTHAFIKDKNISISDLDCLTDSDIPFWLR